MNYYYCVKQNIVDWNGNVVQSDVIRDGLYTLETAIKMAKEIQNRSDEEFCNLNLNEGYRYTFTAEKE